MALDNETLNNSGSLSELETQFVPQENDDELLYEVEEITAERGDKYKVRWAGMNPATGKPWPQDWVSKHDCTDDLVQEWKAKKANKEVETTKKRGSSSRSSTKSRVSTSTSAQSSTRITRQSVLAGPAPPIPSDEKLSTHVSTPTVKMQWPRKRKNRSHSPESSSDKGKDVDERRESPRPRKRRKPLVYIAIGTPTTVPEGPSIKQATKFTKQSDSDLDNHESGSAEEFASIEPVKTGPPRGAKRQGNSEKGKSKLQETPKKTPGSDLKSPHHTPGDETAQRGSSSPTPPKPKPQPVINVPELFPALSPPSPPRITLLRPPESTDRGPILSPGALARLELFDRMMEEPPDIIVEYEVDGTSAQSSTEPPGRAMSNLRLGAPGSEPSGISQSKLSQGPQPSFLSGPHTPQAANGNSEDKMKELTMLDLPDIAVMPVSTSPTVSPVDELASTAKSRISLTRLVRNPPRPLHRKPSTLKAGHYIRSEKVNAAEPPSSSIESFGSPGGLVFSELLEMGRPKGKEGGRPAKVLSNEQDSSNGEDVEEMEETSNNRRLKTDLELRKRGQELFDEEQRKREATRAVGPKPPRKNLAIRPAKKTATTYNHGAMPSSDSENTEEVEDISHIGEEEREQDANRAAGTKPPRKNLAIRPAKKTPYNHSAKSSIDRKDTEEVEDILYNKRLKTDSELRKRGQELADEELRTQEAKAGSKPLRKNLLSRSTQKAPYSHSAKPNEFFASPANKKITSDYHDPALGSGGVAAGTDGVESVVQEMEAAYVDLSGGTQSVTLGTQSLKPTSKDIATLRLVLREEEEENTQEAMEGVVHVAEDQASCMFDYAVEEDAIRASIEPDPVEPMQVQSQDAPEPLSTRTEDLQLASVIVQASQGRKQLDMDDVDTNQPPPLGTGCTSSPPPESQRSVLDTPKRHLGEALALLNVKSEEIQRLERELAHERQNTDTTRIEFTKITQECEALRSSVTEERSRLQAERSELEARRIRWTEDRAAWVEEIERWKHAHDAWEKQRKEPAKEHSKSPEQIASLNSASKIISQEEKMTLQDSDMVISSEEATWTSEREMLVKERDELSHIVTELGHSVDTITAAKLSIEKDRDFFREQYGQASSYVNSVRRENVELEERMKIAESQATEGVTAIKALLQTKVKALQDDVHRWKTLAEMLQAKDSLTDDNVRMRAAQATELEALCKKMIAENGSLQADLRKLGRAQQRVSVHRNKLQRKILSLTKEKASLKMKLAKYSTSQESSHLQVSQQSTCIPEDSESWDPNDVDIVPGSQVAPPEESSYEDISWFSCMWRQKTVLCPRLFDSKEDLVRHMSEHV